MLELLNEVVEWMRALPPVGVYAVVFVVAYLENLVPPIWGDSVVVFGGYLVGLGSVGFVPTVVVSTLGGALGFMTMYGLGWRFDERVWEEGRLAWIPRGPVERVQKWMRRWGYGLVLANRFVSGARSVVPLVVGSARMPVGPTAACATVSAFVWCLLLVWGGYVLGDQWERVGDYLQAYGQVISGLVVALGVGWGVRWLWRRREGRRRRRRPERGQESAKDQP
ncbi:MAG: DedA family protein [Bacteroidota bacterium]